jgi:hypothetical protein
MFSALEWVMKGAVWLVLVLFVYARDRADMGGWGWGMQGAVVFWCVLASII